MKKAITFILLYALFVGALFAQHDSIKGVHKGILSGTLTLPVGYLVSEKATTVYVAGNLEYYTDSKISVRGEATFYVEGAGTAKFLKLNNSIGFGAFYHFQTHSNFDPLIGFQPELGLSQTTNEGDPVTVNPLASVVTGFNFFAEKWFHILVNVRYTAGRHLDEQSLESLNELSFSFGLGFNLDVVK